MILLFLCAVGLAQVPARTIEVQLQDPRGQVKSGLQASVRGASGTQVQVRFRNDGVPPDLEALDTIHTTAFPMADSSMSLILTSGGQTWEVETAIDEVNKNPVITLHLGPNGGLVVVQAADDKPRDTQTATASAPISVSGWVWGGLCIGLGIGMGLGLRWIGRRPVRAVGLRGAPELTPIAPRSLRRADLDAALQVLSEHRVISLGPLDACPAAYAVCAEPGVSPGALVAAVEQHAVRVGGPVALVVVELARLAQDGRRAPLEDLARRVGGRFELWVVDGPPEWSG